MTDTEILDHLENLAYVFTVTLTRDWTYELIIRDSVGHENTIKGGSISLHYS